MTTASRSKTILITGATDGLGLASSLAMARQGHKLILHGRDRERLRAAAERIQGVGGHVAGLEMADFLSLRAVDAMASRILANAAPLDVLICNAGIGSGHAGRKRVLSEDGFEALFAVNYLAGFLLTERLLPLLKQSAEARFIHVASLGQHEIDFEDLSLKTGFAGQRAYGQSKLAQIMHALDLSAQLAGSSVTANALHPATLMPTKLVAEGWGTVIDPLEVGVASLVRLALDPKLAGVTGQFFDRGRRGRYLKQASDPDARRRLREASLAMTEAALLAPAQPARIDVLD